MDMRDIIRLIEDGENAQYAQGGQAQNNAPITGKLNGQDLAKMLSDVDDVAMFSSALMKVENSESGTLTIDEKHQLANAFISLIKIPDAQKTAVIQKMMPVQQDAPPRQLPLAPNNQAQGQPTQGGVLPPQKARL